MTIQLCTDHVLHADLSFAILRKNGTALFEPSAHGLKPGPPVSSSCWAGRQCTYRVANGTLTLDELSIVLEENALPAIKEGTGPLLFGQRPVYKKSLAGNARYTGLQGPIAFSGGLLLGTEGVKLKTRLPLMSIHGAPSYGFSKVHELIFENGRLVSAADHSEAMARLREDQEGRPLDFQLGQTDLNLRYMRVFRLNY